MLIFQIKKKNWALNHIGGRCLIITFVFVLLFYFAFLVRSDSLNKVSLNIDQRFMVDTDSDLVTPGEYSAREEYSLDLFNGKDGSGKSLGKISLTIEPKEPEKVIEIQTSNLDLLSRKPVKGTGENIGEEEGATLTLMMKGEKSIEFPLKVAREADETYFEKTKKQTIGLKVTPNSAEIKELSISIVLNGPWNKDKAKIKFISASREYFQNLFQSIEEERVDFSVVNPVKDKEYLFTVQAEVTPLQEQVTYLPDIWVGATVEKDILEQRQGKVLEKETEFGLVKAESTEELFFDSAIMKSLVVSISGVAVQERLDLKTPVFSPPEKEVLKETDNESRFSNINWEFIGVTFGILSAILSVVWAGRNRRKKHKVIDQHIEEIDTIYFHREKTKEEKKKILWKIRRKIAKEVSKGKIDESTYSILDKKVDDYLEEL